MPKTQRDAKGGKGGDAEPKKTKGPMIVTVETNGRERRWGPLSRPSAWRAGSFWEDIDGDARVFIETDAERKEMSVERRIEGGTKKASS